MDHRKNARHDAVSLPMTTAKLFPSIVLLLGLLVFLVFYAPFILVLAMLALLVWAALIASARACRMALGRLDRVERKLARALNLEPGRKTAGVAVNGNWTQTRLACLKKMNKARSYCSRTVVKDFTNDKLALRKFVDTQWRADFAEPDRWHVTQESVAHDGCVLWDEWISIGCRTYQNAGLWFQTEEIRHDDLNLKLSMHALLKIVKEQTPTGFAEFRNKFVVARYSWGSVKATGYWGITDDEAGNPVFGNLEVWIDVQTSQIIKGEISAYKGTLKALTISQAFACFDEEIEIAEPPWLNAITDESGKGTILDTRVAIVRHHC